MDSGVLEPGSPICPLGYSSSSRETCPENLSRYFLSVSPKRILHIWYIICLFWFILLFLDAPLFFLPLPPKSCRNWVFELFIPVRTGWHWPKGSEVVMGVGWVDWKSCVTWLCRYLILRKPGQKSCLPSFPLLWKPQNGLTKTVSPNLKLFLSLANEMEC